MIFWKIFRKIYEMAAEKMCQELDGFLRKREKILDLGCGSGIFGGKIEEIFEANVFGIDVVDRRIFKIPFQIYDGKKIPFSDNFFDWVIISFVLHHTQDPIEILKEAKRVAKRIVIFEDLPEGIFSKARCFFHFLSWHLFFGQNSKFNFFKEKDWEKIFERLNLKLIEKKEFSPPFKFLDPTKRKIFILEK